MSKNFFIALVIIFFTTLLAFIIHSISSDEAFFAKKETERKTESATETEVVTEEVEEQTEKKIPEGEKIYKLIKGEEGPIKGAVLNKTTSQVLYYQNRNFLLTDFKGQAKSSIGGYPFIDVRGIKWNSNRNKALIKEKTDYIVYDLNKNTIIKLAEKVEYADWYNNGTEDRLVYKTFNYETKERKIITADENGENEEDLVENLQYERIDFKIPKGGNKICYNRAPDANFEASLDCIDIKSKQTETLHKGVFAADYLWANNGNRLIVSYVNEQMGGNITISSMNSKGGEFRGLNFPTSVKKCVWSNDNRNIYCAMMVYAEKDVVLPNDWEANKYNSIDTFWKIDVETGKKRRLLESSEMIPVDAENLFLDDNEKFLFFTDRVDRSVYAIPLK